MHQCIFNPTNHIQQSYTLYLYISYLYYIQNNTLIFISILSLYFQFKQLHIYFSCYFLLLLVNYFSNEIFYILFFFRSIFYFLIIYQLLFFFNNRQQRQLQSLPFELNKLCLKIHQGQSRGECTVAIDNIFTAYINNIKDFMQKQEYKQETLSTPGVIDKYQAAGKIANEVLSQVIKKIKVGVKVVEICIFGDNLIESQCLKVYNKKPVPKGIAFPTCISINEICGHYSPFIQQTRSVKQGDLVKIDLGVHIDGFIALVAHTIVVQSDINAPVTGRHADVILAAYKSIQAGLRQLKPGYINNQVTKTIQKVTNAYGVNPLEGVLSHELKKHLIDGNNTIINKETFEQKVEDHQFGVNEVYAFDVIVSTGSGTPKQSEFRCTVYKRAIERNYNLKTKHGRTFLAEVLNRYPSLGFSLNSFQDEITTKLGVTQCLKHDLLNGYPVLTQKQGDLVAQFKITVMILQGGTISITGLPIDESKFKTENEIKDQSVLELLKTSMDRAEQKKKKKEKIAVQQVKKQ